MRISLRARRGLLWAFTALSTYVGAWALLAPASWWVSFPGAGRHWLPMLGPYNEHLARDVGALYLALAVLTAGAALRASDTFLTRLTATALLVFSVPHFLYHVTHLSHFEPIDQLGNILSLGLFVIVPALLLFPARPPETAAAPR
jgi:hypothetical protein